MFHISRGVILFLLIVAMDSLQIPISVQAMNTEIMALDESDSLYALASVLSLHKLWHKASESEIKIFEVGGGDPAMNGAHIYVCIAHNDRVFVWKTAIDIRSVVNISVSKDSVVHIDAKQDYMAQDATIRSRRVAYDVHFYIVGDQLQQSIFVERSFDK